MYTYSRGKIGVNQTWSNRVHPYVFLSDVMAQSFDQSKQGSLTHRVRENELQGKFLISGCKKSYKK